MANYYLRPRRGTEAVATANEIILKKGEVFFEVPDTGVGTGAGRIKMGDGNTVYADLPYFTADEIDVSNSNITFTPSTSTSNSVLLNEIVSGATLATIIGSVKTLLSNLDSSVTSLNNDIDNLGSSVINNSSSPSTLTLQDTASYIPVINSDGTINKVSFHDLYIYTRVYDPDYNDSRELTEYSWTDIRNMSTYGDLYKWARPGDYKFITLSSGETVQMELAGIDTERHCGPWNATVYINGSTISGQYDFSHMSDWISKECLSTTIEWNATLGNNGTGSMYPLPYYASDLNKWLNSTVYKLLPSDVSSVITERITLLEYRYNSSSKLTDSTNWNWADIGYLWTPSEPEVYGQNVWSFGSTSRWSVGMDVQYPIFANKTTRRIKHSGYENSSRCHWWLRDVRCASSATVCAVSNYGHPSNGGSTLSNRVPLCFRIANA